MAPRRERFRLRVKRVSQRLKSKYTRNPLWQFVGNVVGLIGEFRSFLYVREAALIGSQFLVVFLTLSMRERLNMTAWDFTEVVGYTTQVAAAFISAAACLDAIVSYTRAYHIYATAYNAATSSEA